MRGRVVDYPVDRLKAVRVNGAAHGNIPLFDTTIPTLDQVIELLNQNPEITAYVEIKRQSLDYFGLERCIDCVIEALLPAQFPWVLISFAHDAIRYARTRYALPIGWVLHEYSDDARTQAQALEPAYLFCNVKRLPKIDRPFWQGSWQWVIYEINDPHHAMSLLHQGADMIETSCITKLLNSSTLNTGDSEKRITTNEITKE